MTLPKQVARATGGHHGSRLRRPSELTARSLERTFAVYRPHLLAAIEQRVGQPRATEILAAARSALRDLAPRVPPVRPGDWLRDNLYGAAVLLAVGRVLEAQGFAVEEVSAISMEAVVGRLNTYPRPVLRHTGRLRFSMPYQHVLAARSRRSQRREYPGEWVYDRVAGDGRSFEWGIDYRRCPILDLYRAEGSEDLMSAVCPLDFAISERMGDGLARTTTLAAGGDRCDFRYRGARTVGGGTTAGAGSRDLT